MANPISQFPSYSILATEGLPEIEVDPGSRLIMEMRPDGLPALFELKETARGFDALLAAIDAGSAEPEVTGAALRDLRAALTQLAAHERNCAHVGALPGLAGADAWLTAFEDFRPDERGRCCCQNCETAKRGTLILVR